MTSCHACWTLVLFLAHLPGWSDGLAIVREFMLRETAWMPFKGSWVLFRDLKVTMG